MTTKTVIRQTVNGQTEAWEIEHDDRIDGDELFLAVVCGGLYLDPQAGVVRQPSFPTLYQPEIDRVVAKIVRTWKE
jgi:hypothetical protein